MNKQLHSQHGSAVWDFETSFYSHNTKDVENLQYNGLK